MLKYIVKNKSGSTALMITVMILTSILTVTIAVGEIVRLGLVAGKTQVQSTKAYFAAEAGAERVLYDIRKGTPPLNPYNGGGGLNCPAAGANLCFDGQNNTPITSCQTPCPIGKFDFQNLSNGSKYSLKYYEETIGPDVFSVIKSYGEYTGNRRVIELRYKKP